MFERFGSILNYLLVMGFGAFAFWRPFKLAGKTGTPEQIAKRARNLKWAGAVMFASSLILIVLELARFK